METGEAWHSIVSAPPLETSLVEWKRGPKAWGWRTGGYLGNFLSGMETGQAGVGCSLELPPWKLP